MLCKVADLLVEVPATGDMPQRCKEYLYTGEGRPDIVIDIAEYNPNRWPGLQGAELDYMESGVHFFLKLLQFNGMMLHSSAVVRDGKAYLFTARSGTGKSTHTRLWRETFGDRVSMINDDKPFLKILPQGVTVFGTPWQGKHRLGQNTSVPLKALCILCRGEENRMEPITPKEALPILLQQTFSPVDPQAMIQTLALVQQLSKTVRLYRLYCNMDPQAALVARDAIFDKENV